jgi:hypothetical protein
MGYSIEHFKIIKVTIPYYHSDRVFSICIHRGEGIGTYPHASRHNAVRDSPLASSPGRLGLPGSSRRWLQATSRTGLRQYRTFFQWT